MRAEENLEATQGEATVLIDGLVCGKGLPMARDREDIMSKTAIRAACWAILDSPKFGQVGGRRLMIWR